MRTVTREEIDGDVLRAHVVVADRIEADEIHAVTIERMPAALTDAAALHEGESRPPRPDDALGF